MFPFFLDSSQPIEGSSQAMAETQIPTICSLSLDSTAPSPNESSDTMIPMIELHLVGPDQSKTPDSASETSFKENSRMEDSFRCRRKCRLSALLTICTSKKASLFARGADGSEYTWPKFQKHLHRHSTTATKNLKARRNSAL